MSAIWIRSETRPAERRTPLVPEDVARLVRLGIPITVERSAQRVVPDEVFAAAGADLADGGSWISAPVDAVVLGLKELPHGPDALRHRHVFFGHAYKGQPGADALLARFSRGGGDLLDLEYVCDGSDRRLVAFGWWAGYVGAALAVLHHRGCLRVPLVPTTRDELDAELDASRHGSAERALVLGALGRSGRGALAALAQAGVTATAWDIDETRVLDRTALLDHDIVVNTVLTTVAGEPFLRPGHLADQGRRMTVLSDVTCDVGSPCNLFPLYDIPTSWAAPVRRIVGGPVALDAIVIDNLPSVLPLDASRSFSADLWPLVPALTGTDITGGWARSLDAFRSATHHRQESLHV